MPPDMDLFPNGRCCVFQPFDNGGDFDKRFDETLSPAIKAAGMEPYRVDRDLGSVIPVETLHQEIGAAAICLADITTRNPNVMYELGFAVAAGSSVIIISGPSIEKYPFDIAHRGIISYTTGSISALETLKAAVTAKLRALLQLKEQTNSITVASPIKSSEGLEPHELTALAFICASSDSMDDRVGAPWLKQKMRESGYTDVGTRLAVSRLIRLGYVKADRDNDGLESWVVYQLEDRGEVWLLDNQSKFNITDPTHKRRVPDYATYKKHVPDYGDSEITDDDIPF